MRNFILSKEYDVLLLKLYFNQRGKLKESNLEESNILDQRGLTPSGIASFLSMCRRIHITNEIFFWVTILYL